MTPGSPQSPSKLPAENALSVHPLWDRPVQFVKGVGPRRAGVLRDVGIETGADLLLHLPRRYLDRSSVVPLDRLVAEQDVTVIGKVAATGTIKGRTPRFEAIVVDGHGQLSLVWFKGGRWVKDVLKKNVVVAVSGTVKYFQGLQMVHPEFEVLEEWDADDLTHTGRVIPVYPSGEAWRAARLDSRMMRRIIKPVVTGDAVEVNDYLPPEVLDTVGMPTLEWTLQNAHYPGTLDDAEFARQRLAFDEFFFLELTLAQRRTAIDRADEGRACPGDGHLARTLVDGLPWSLTGAQRRVIGEITTDLRAKRPMRRLLQGDVGSGKTVVAATAMALWAETGAQAVLLVPTEILAEQHWHTLTRLFEPCGIAPVLVTGSLKAAERRDVLDQLRDGSARIVIGTHALLSDGVEFSDLGMIVIDEQHRFGVAQRQTLISKGHRPDLLVMTATPIPRTLALTLYGDLDVSVLNEKPPQKGTTRTVWRTESAREKIYEYIAEATQRGVLTYIVYPLVEQSEKVDLKAAKTAYEDLCKRLPNLRIGLVHGRVRATDRQEVMDAFYSGNLDVLVSTTVIEVGVDAPEARLMIIENAERFGLSQLHQLRGRIGRGPGESICVLMIGSHPTPIAQERLEVMCRTADGFEIAEADLKLRGPGEFLGTRQHGMPEFKTAHLVRDAALLQPARDAAFRILNADTSLAAAGNARLRTEWERRFSQRREFLGAG